MSISVSTSGSPNTCADVLECGSRSCRFCMFLGSDIVGLFKRRQFALLLAAEADLLIERWSSVAERDKGWVLNYKWAASRCDERMYASLEELLMTTPHADIQQWILFVPQSTSVPVGDGHPFMKEKAHRNNPTTLQLVLGAMARLDVKASQRKALRRFAGTFKDVGLAEAYAETTHTIERRVKEDRRALPRRAPDRRHVPAAAKSADLERYDEMSPD